MVSSGFLGQFHFLHKSDGFGIWFGFFIRWEAWFWEGLLLVPLDHFLKACLFLIGVRSAPSCTQCPGSGRGWGSVSCCSQLFVYQGFLLFTFI